MVKQSTLIVMEMLHMTNKGMGILDILIVLFIVSSLSLVAIVKYREPDFEYLYLTNEILKEHVNSLINKNDCSFKNGEYYFNENGNINKAGTIHFPNKDLILHLGNGYLVYE